MSSTPTIIVIAYCIVTSQTWAQERLPVRIGSEPDYQPFAAVDADGKPVGYTVDLIRAIAEVSALDLEIHTAPWPELLAAFRRGELDCLPNMGRTAERRQFADFSIPHYTIHIAAFPAVGIELDERGPLPHHRLGVMAADIGQNYVDEHLPAYANLATFATLSDAFDALQEGRLDVVVAGDVMGLKILQQTDSHHLVGDWQPLPAGDITFAMAVQPGDLELLDRINRGLILLGADGRWETIRERWFGLALRDRVWQGWRTLLWILASISGLSVLSGTIMFLHRRRLQSELAEQRRLWECSEERYRAWVEAAPVGVFLCDPHGRYRAVNDAGCGLFGRPRSEILRLGPFDVVVPEDRSAAIKYFERLKCDGRLAADLRIRRGDANIRSIHIDGVRLPNGDLISFCFDCTAFDHERAALRASRSDAVDEARAQGRFLARMSHEIRTPMVGVLGMAEDLLHRCNDDQRGQLQVITDCGHSLLCILDDVLDYSSLRSGTLQLQPQPTDVGQLLQQVRTLFAPRAATCGLSLRVQESITTGKRVLVDARRLQQVLINLVSNALKYTQVGGVRLEAAIEQRSDTEAALRLLVADTGIGIPEELQRDLDRPFSPAHRLGLRAEGGTGLGLSISSWILRAMQADVSIDSQVGAGTRITITIPTTCACDKAAINDDRPEVVPATAMPRARLLLIEDNPINARVFRAHAERLGHCVTLAATGAEALTVIEPGRFDLIFCDLHLPDMHGAEVIAALRQRSDPWSKDVPVIACTASIAEEDHRRATEAGMQDVLVKPFRRASLAALIDRFYPSSGSDGPPLRPTARSGTRSFSNSPARPEPEDRSAPPP